MSILSNATQIGKDFVNSAVGRTDKACLVVHDVRAKSSSLEPDLGAASGLGGGLSNTASKADQLAQTSDALNGGSAASVLPTQSDDKILFVQFNPSSLQIRSWNQHDDRRNLNGDNEKQGAQTDAMTAPVIDLTLALIFDEVNVYDSFMADKIQGANISTVTNAISGMMKTFTVQPYVEGFISAIRNYYTRYMTFQWADFSFTGMLVNLNAVYTMFSVSGHPVRAQVQLLLRQDLRKTESEKWKKDFEEMVKINNWFNSTVEQETGQASSDFEAMTSGGKSLTSASQYVGNLLNIGL